MGLLKQFGAVGHLGWRALVGHPLERLRRGRRRGKRLFLQHYGPEGLVPLTGPDREGLASFMGCTGCGLCDLVCPLVGRLDRRDFRGPSLVALAYTRATPDLGHVASTLDRLPADCGDCTLCQTHCPSRVPLRSLFAYANRKLSEMEALRAPSGPPARG